MLCRMLAKSILPPKMTHFSLNRPWYEPIWPCLIIACFKKLNPFLRSNLKFQICSMHRISRGIHIRIRLSPILIKLVGTRFGFYAKNAVPYKFQNFEKSFFEQIIFIFALPLTIASRKRVNSGERPLKCRTPKNEHIWALLNK